ncbi:MAG: hypothetical protein OEY43_04860 [Gammaproteobacteria bacterium]|nr:hypothetical protein [Gammaproteobacteria bacterium]
MMLTSKNHLYLVLLIGLACFDLQADIRPVVIETDFKLAEWQPLPEDKIRSAAVESALGEISKTRQFAFFTTPQPDQEMGRLKISIQLVEKAETATVSILLQQAGGVSISSTHSESLKNQYYDGIYKRFQQAGAMAGRKIVEILESHPEAGTHQDVSHNERARVTYLENQIISINNKIIQQADKNPVRSEAKLEYILSELRSINSNYGQLAKKEDLQKQGVKIDKVLEEVGQLNKKIDNKPNTQINVKQNYVIENALIGQTIISNKSQPGRDDAEARRLYDEAQELKLHKKYRQAEINLERAIKLSISADLNSLIFDELNYSLPMFEAQALAIDLGRNFQVYSQDGQQHAILDRITRIYKMALKNNQHDFQRTRQIQQMLDQHVNTSSAMSAVLSAQSRIDFRMLHQRIEMKLMMTGKFPEKLEFEELLKTSGINHKLLAYTLDKEVYKARLRAPDGEIITIKGDGYKVEIE